MSKYSDVGLFYFQRENKYFVGSTHHDGFYVFWFYFVWKLKHIIIKKTLDSKREGERENLNVKCLNYIPLHATIKWFSVYVNNVLDLWYF